MKKRKDFSPEFDIRKSQLLTPFGIGALTEVKNQTLMIADSEYWDELKCEIIHDIRLEKIMDASGFIVPPDKDEGEIQGKRFPTWYYSPKDRSLKRIVEWKKLAVKKPKDNFKFDKAPYDYRSSKIELVPVRLICACNKGHAQDFPWIEWAHRKTQFDKSKPHNLKLVSIGQTGTIADLSVQCTNCNTNEKLINIFDKDKFPLELEKLNVKCNGYHFWKKNEKNKECKADLKVLLKNSNNFYFPNIVSSVNIPFIEDRLMNKIQQEYARYYEGIEFAIHKFFRRNQSDEKSFLDDSRVKMAIEDLAEEIGESEKTISEIFFNKHIKNDENVNVMDYRIDEFSVLTGRKEFDKENGNLDIQVLDKSDWVENKYSKLIESITLVHELEVVSALKSYSRIEAPDSDLIAEQEYEGKEGNKDFEEVSLKRDDNQYVGILSKGEGIFINFNKEAINKWYSVVENTSIAQSIFDKFNDSKNIESSSYFHPIYYMIHTLSHLLIKELSISSGYSASSIKERIYFSNEESTEMYGILLYTSSNDSQGTLGGLVKQGIPENLFSLISNAVEKAKWCSFDPICIESDSQGRDSLNGAACHACSLISETSCEKLNVFLDRKTIIGTLDEPHLGFLS